MAQWKLFHYECLPPNAKLTIWYKYVEPIVFYEYDQSVYRLYHATSTLVFPSTTLLRSTHVDEHNHILCTQTQSTVRLYEIPTLNLLNEQNVPTDLVPLVATQDRIVYRDSYGVPTYYCMDWSNNIIYIHAVPGTLLTYAHTADADYYVYKDKILRHSNADHICIIRKLPFWIYAATINFILTEPYCFGVSENGRVFMVSLQELFSTNEPNCSCLFSAYNYLPRASVGLDIWASENECVVIPSRVYQERASVIQKMDQVLSFLVLVDGEECSSGSHFTIDLTPTTITSPSNSSIDLTLTITPYNNFTGTVNLSLSNAPSGVSISPTSVNVPGPDPVVSTITLIIEGDVAPDTYNMIFNAISGSIHEYTNLDLTVQQQQQLGGSNYGYVCGGYSNNELSTIDRFQFPFDSGTASYVGNLSGSSAIRVSANNSSSYGYVCGGHYGFYKFSTIDRFQFPFDSGTASYVGDLSGNKWCLSANNSSIYGYVCGGNGDNGGYLSTIDRFQFPLDSGIASQVGNLSVGRGDSSANNSSTHGYVCGGVDVSYYLSPTIERFQFPFDSGTANQVGNLSGSRGDSSANNSSTHGYVCGGDNGGYLSTIDRFQFPFDSGTANQVGNLSGSRDLLSANNSSTYGYVCGGQNISDYFSTIDRFQFPFDSGTANYVGNLSGSRRNLSAADGVDFVTMFVWEI